MPETITILGWSEVFETAKTRKLQSLAWFHNPTGNDSRGYRALVRKGTAGFAALGVFAALSQAMGKQRMEARRLGTFQNSDGSGMDLADVWDVARIPPTVGRDAVPLLLEAQWIRLDDCQPSASRPPLPPSRPPGDSQPSPGPAQSSTDKDRYGEEGIGEDGSGGGEEAAATTQAEKLVAACPKPGLTIPACRAAQNCIRRHRGKITFDEILEATQAVTLAVKDWTDSERLQFIPNAERFFFEDLWRRAPEEWHSRASRRKRTSPVDTGGRTFQVLDLRDENERPDRKAQ